MRQHFKIIVIALIVIQISGIGFLYQPKTAEASWLLGVDTGMCAAYGWVKSELIDPIADYFKTKGKEKIAGLATGLITTEVPIYSSQLPPATKEITDKQDAILRNDKKTTCEQNVQKFVLTVLKRRILDRLVDQTVRWIQGDGTPQFITNPEGFLSEAGQAAVGDVAQEIGLGELCQPISARLQLNLMKVGPLAPRVSCTLDQIVGNIQNFRDNFMTGGWIGYQELLSPRNNSYGITLMAMEESRQKQEEQERARELEAIGGQGFLSQKACYEWTNIYTHPTTGKLIKGVFENGQFIAEDGGGERYDQYPTPLNVTFVAPTMLNGETVKCTKELTVTPGRLLGDAISQAGQSDWEFIINAEDASDYIAAIADAIFYRLSKESVTGLKGLFQNNANSPARGGGAAKYGNAVDPDGSLGQANSDYTNFMDRFNAGAREGRTDIIKTLQQQLASATENLNDANTLITNAQTTNETTIAIIDVKTHNRSETGLTAANHPNTTTQLIDCFIADGGRGNTTTSAALDTALATYEEASSIWRTTLTGKIADVNDKKNNALSGLPYYQAQVDAIAASPSTTPSERLIGDVQKFLDATENLRFIDGESYDANRTSILEETQDALLLCLSPTWP